MSKDVTNNGVTTSTKFLCDGGNIALELDGAGVQAAYNVYGGGSIISRGTAQSLRYYLYNGRGDAVQLSTTGGNTVAEYDCDAFGNLLILYSAYAGCDISAKIEDAASRYVWSVYYRILL